MSPKPVVLVVIDGLTPSMFEAADTPALRFLAEHGEYRRAASTFPSLTPVCLSSIATGEHPDVHEIPHLVWWNREEQRLVEYGSSFGAVRAAGIARSLRDTVIDLNAQHLGKRAETIYEALEDAGLTTAAINITCYRGRHRASADHPGRARRQRPEALLLLLALRERSRPGAPLAVRNRALGSIDAYAAAVGRWLVTRDGFDLLVYYLPDYDFASHAAGPDQAHEALARSDAAVAALMDAAGGPDAFLERYAVVVCSDHGQSRVEQTARLDVGGDLVTASNRAAMVYTDEPRRIAEALDAEPSAGHRRSSRRTVASSRAATATRTSRCSTTSPTGACARPPRSPTRTRARCSSPPRPAGSSTTSPAGTITAAAATARSSAADSEVPMLTVGLGAPPASITGIKALVAGHFGVAVRDHGVSPAPAVGDAGRR